MAYILTFDLKIFNYKIRETSFKITDLILNINLINLDKTYNNK